MYTTQVPVGRKVMYLTLHPAPFPRGTIPGGHLSTIPCSPLNARPLSLHPPGVAPLLPGTGESRVRGNLRGMLGAASVPPRALQCCAGAARGRRRPRRRRAALRGASPAAGAAICAQRAARGAAPAAALRPSPRGWGSGGVGIGVPAPGRHRGEFGAGVKLGGK